MLMYVFFSDRPLCKILKDWSHSDLEMDSFVYVLRSLLFNSLVLSKNEQHTLR